MRRETLGGEDADYTVIAAIHGDEPCGLRAVEALRANESALREPVQVVVANERALDRGVRYVSADLNRSFPGDPTAEAEERRLAAEVLAAVSDTMVLDLHSTRSCAEPFAVMVGDQTQLAAATGTAHVVEASYVGGGLLAHAAGVAVECGRLGTTAAAGNAVRVTGRFLAAVGALDSPAAVTDDLPDPDPDHPLPVVGERFTPTCYRIDGEVAGTGYEFRGENFRRVERGETFAVRDEHPVTADEPFYPVLMSTDGYDDKLGYRASRLGPLDEVTPTELVARDARI